MSVATRIQRGSATVLAILLVALAGCGTSDDVGGSGATPKPFSVVVIGDSIPYNASQDCPGCVSFAQSYTEALTDRLERKVTLDNRSRHDGARTRDIDEQLSSGDLEDALADADIVIASVGFNDQPPYGDAGQPCAAGALDSDEQAIAAILKTSRACVARATRSLQPTLKSVLSQVREQAPEATIATLVPYNSWTGWPELTKLSPDQKKHIDAIVTYGLDQWRTALCSLSATVDATCVDAYAEFNGDQGLTPADKLVSSDYTHPSQQGNDAIRDLLLAAELEQ